MKKLLWIGDAISQTGFARVTHSVLAHLHEKWDVHVLGINYRGDPHPYPYRIYPAELGGDAFGVGRVHALCRMIEPDVVVVNNDPWIVVPIMEQVPDHIPVVAYMPVDAPNQSAAPSLNTRQSPQHQGKLIGLARAIAYTNFGRKELLMSGFGGRCDVIPHGVDTDIYQPVDQKEALAQLQFNYKFPDEPFIVGNVNRNQPRKRLDLTIQYFTEWWNKAGCPANAFLHLHAGNRDLGYNLIQLANYYGIEKRFIITDKNMNYQPGRCAPEDKMKFVYGAHAVHVNTSMGEGWGLTTHESMACGVPQIVPNYAALGEWAKGAVAHVPVTSYAVTEKGINTIGGIVDRVEFVKTLDRLHKDPDERRALGAAGLARATESQFAWSMVAERFNAILTETVGERAGNKPVGVEA